MEPAQMLEDETWIAMPHGCTEIRCMSSSACRSKKRSSASMTLRIASLRCSGHDVAEPLGCAPGPVRLMELDSF
eukprot:366522-Chlamydomonas_euryale.AAC.15